MREHVLQLSVLSLGHYSPPLLPSTMPLLPRHPTPSLRHPLAGLETIIDEQYFYTIILCIQMYLLNFLLDLANEKVE